MGWKRIMLLALVLLIAAAFGYAWWSGQQFEQRIAQLRLDLTPTAAPGTPDLPDLVRRYAEKAGGKLGAPAIIEARHAAMLSTALGQPPISITAEQWTGTNASQLVWRGEGRMLGLPVAVVDSFVDGKGLLEARLAGAFRVAFGAGAEFDAGELQRYLSELPFYPDAILNNADLTWRQIDADTLEVTGQSASGPASVRFSFDAAGDIVGLEAERPMAIDSVTRLTPWRGVYSNYQQFGGYRIPSHGEVAWVMPDGPFIYWRGDITAYGPPAD